MISKDVINAVTKNIKQELNWYLILMACVSIGYAVIVFAKLPFNYLVEASYVMVCIIIIGLIQCVLKLSNLVKSIGNSLGENKEHANDVSEMKVN